MSCVLWFAQVALKIFSSGEANNGKLFAIDLSAVLWPYVKIIYLLIRTIT